MNPPEPRPRQHRYSARHQARLDAETFAKLEALATQFHCKRAANLRCVVQWALAYKHGWTIDSSILGRPHVVHMLVEPELRQPVQDAADAQDVTVAAWLRHAMRQVPPEDLPASWRAGETAVRSHDSGYYDRRFQLRIDQATQRKLEALMQTFGRSAAEVIRQLIAQATSEDLPSSWQMTAHDRCARKAQPSHDGVSGRDTL
jgi:hypothetical protein